jgi:hypothetical protein
MKLLQLLCSIVLLVGGLSLSSALAEGPQGLPPYASDSGQGPNVGGPTSGGPGFGREGAGPFRGNGERGQMFRFCRENLDDAKCAEIRQKMKAHFQELRQRCQENPNDERCVRMREARQNLMEEIRKKCAENPGDERCQRFQQLQQLRGGQVPGNFGHQSQ